MTTAVAETRRYSIAVCKGGALLQETKTLLRAWEPGESPADFRERVVREDILGKMTAHRAGDIVGRVFGRRYLRPSNRPALLLKRLLERGHPGPVFSDLCLLYAARADDLMRDAVTRLYWPALAEGRVTISPSYVVEFLREAERDGRLAAPWSENVKLKIARGVLKALTEFGLLKQIGRGKRELIHFHASDGAIAYVAYDLHFEGYTDSALLNAEDWRLFGLRTSDVASALDRLSGAGWWVAQVAGVVVRITWKYRTMEEVVHALS